MKFARLAIVFSLCGIGSIVAAYMLDHPEFRISLAAPSSPASSMAAQAQPQPMSATPPRLMQMPQPGIAPYSTPAQQGGSQALQLPTLDRPMNVLFMGTDVVYSRPNAKTAAPDPSSYEGNSDSLMLVHLDPQNHRVTVLQIPRDTKVPIPGHGTQKINAANPIGGVPLAEQTVSSFLGVPIDHYVVMNVHGIVDLVNEIGGITVEVPKRMQYMDWTAKLKIDLTPGFHTLTGNQAMGFIRFRHDALGDIGRIQRQQLFMDAVVRKLANPLEWSHAPALVAIGERNIQTDLSNVDILKSAYFIHSLPRNEIRFVMLPGRFSTDGTWRVDQSEAQTFVSNFVNPNAELASDKSKVLVCVENISSDPQLGRRVSRELRKRGYSVFVNRPSVRSSTWRGTQVIAQRGNLGDAQAVWNELGQHGNIINASIGDIESSVTVLVNDDLQGLFKQPS